MNTTTVAVNAGESLEPRAERGGSRSAWATQFDVIKALILHDVKSRYFGNGMGYVVMVLWPGVHVGVLMVIYLFTGRAAPYGNSKMLFIATGVYPYIVWNYVSRFTMMGAISNKCYLSYPVIKPLDLIFSRIILETNTGFIILILLCAVLELSGASIIPADPLRVGEGILAALVLGISFGVFGAVFCMISPFFGMAYILVLIGFWITSGVAINPEFLPVSIGDMFAWNPLLHCIELVRSGYYPDFPTRLLSRTYVFGVSFAFFTLGLILERVLQRSMRL